MSGPKETSIPQTPKSAPNIQKQAQPEGQEDFCRLAKSQHSLGICEACSCLPKGVISFTYGKKDIWLLAYQRPPAPLVSQMPVTHFKVHVSRILALLTSSPTLKSLQVTGFPTPVTHSSYNPAILFPPCSASHTIFSLSPTILPSLQLALAQKYSYIFKFIA